MREQCYLNRLSQPHMHLLAYLDMTPKRTTCFQIPLAIALIHIQCVVLGKSPKLGIETNSWRESGASTSITQTRARLSPPSLAGAYPVAPRTGPSSLLSPRSRQFQRTRSAVVCPRRWIVVSAGNCQLLPSCQGRRSAPPGHEGALFGSAVYCVRQLGK